MANHYPALVVWRQKISAILHRSTTQARDVFDLHLLLEAGLNPDVALAREKKPVIAKSKKRLRRRLRAVQKPGSLLPGTRLKPSLRYGGNLGRDEVACHRGVRGEHVMRLVDVLARLLNMGLRCSRRRTPRLTWASGTLTRASCWRGWPLRTLGAAGPGPMGIQGPDRSLGPSGISHGTLPELRVSSIGPLPSWDDLSIPPSFMPFPSTGQKRTDRPGDGFHSPCRPLVLLRHQLAGKGAGKIATPEKALIDFLYLGPTKTHLFRALPETRVAQGLQSQRGAKNRPANPLGRRRNHVSRLFEEIWSHSGNRVQRGP